MWRRNAVTNSRPDEDFIRDDARPSPDESAEEIEVELDFILHYRYT